MLIRGVRHCRPAAILGAIALSLVAGGVASTGSSAAAAASPTDGRWVAASEHATPGAGSAAGHAGGQAARKSGLAPRIVGGQPTTIGEWPWQVAVTLNDALYQGNGFERQFCGGSLVAPQVVVTAAHCFYDEGAGGFPPADQGFGPEYSVISGRTTLSGPGGQEIAVSDYYWFVEGAGDPLYDPGTNRWDVVILELASASAQSAVRVAGPGEEPVWAPGQDADITGWGTTSEGGQGSDTLREARISILADERCGAYGKRFKPALMLCGGRLAGGVDTCQGDSGGPLVAPIEGGGFRLVGLTSWGDGCARPGKPGVYARLAAHPIRSALAQGIQQLFGVDVLGSGAQPAPDTTPPEARITAGPRPRTTSRTATFRFLSNEPEASFACSLDGSAYRACASGKTYARLSLGGHVFRARATDGDANTGAPAKHSFRVVRKK
jgi:Trypsin